MDNAKIKRKGWLRIVEATIGVMLILGSILIYYQRNSIEVSDNFGENLPILADEIAKNDTLRSEIVNVNLANTVEVNVTKMKVNAFLSLRIGRSDLNHAVEICNATGDCKLDFNVTESDGNLYGYERIISTNINSSAFNPETTPKKIKLYVWKIK